MRRDSSVWFFLRLGAAFVTFALVRPYVDWILAIMAGAGAMAVLFIIQQSRS